MRNPHPGPPLVVDEPAEAGFSISRGLYTDPGLFELEIQRIFEGGWVYLAHEGQLPRPNDYFTTMVGRRSVLLTRDTDGVINGFFNACAHRGAALCRSEQGNKRALVCPYHGWTYDTKGRNLHIKARDTGGYTDTFARRSHDLKRLARVEQYRGFVFGSVNENVPPLAEYLGPATAFIDLLVDQSPEGIEIIAGHTSYRYRGNWKLLLENGVDGYHFTTVHASYVQLMRRRSERERETQAEQPVGSGFYAYREAGWYDLGHGHALLWLVSIPPENRLLRDERETLQRRVGPERAKWMVDRQRILLLFPNVQLVDNKSSQIRVIRPLAPDLTEVRSYCFGPRGEASTVRKQRLAQFEEFVGSGLGTPDDLAVFENVQIGCNADPEFVQGYDRGSSRIQPGPDEEARLLGIVPNASGPNPQDEVLYHGVYRQWSHMMKLDP